MRRKKGYFPGTISLMLSHRLASQLTCANTINRLKTHIRVKVTPRNDTVRTGKIFSGLNSEIVLITIIPLPHIFNAKTSYEISMSMLLLKMYCGEVVSWSSMGFKRIPRNMSKNKKWHMVVFRVFLLVWPQPFTGTIEMNDFCKGV